MYCMNTVWNRPYNVRTTQRKKKEEKAKNDTEALTHKQSNKMKIKTIPSSATATHYTFSFNEEKRRRKKYLLPCFKHLGVIGIQSTMHISSVKMSKGI